MLTLFSGVKTRHLLQPVSRDLNQATVLKVHQPLVDILVLEPLPPTTLNMAECLNNRDLSLLDQCLTSNPQANSPVNNKDTVDRPLNPPLSMATNSKWDMVVPPALVAMVVELSKHQTLNGVRQQAKTSTMALVDILNNLSTSIFEWQNSRGLRLGLWIS